VKDHRSGGTTPATGGCEDVRDQFGPEVDFGDLLGELGIADRSRTRSALAAGVEGGSGDLEQFTRA
jgi:hypothetical protein